tara:strand:+ start:1439 stop:1735 length:297 start_codon:yes stop_codon:yes gene_type:complete
MAKITDPKMKPYYIGKDAHCYTVYEVVTPQEKYLEKGSEGKDYEKPVSHHSDFGNALKRVMKEKLHNEKEHYESIREYVTRWDQLKEELSKILEFKQL